MRVIQVAKLDSPWNCASRCQPFHPCFLRKINGFFFIPHHAEGAGIDFVPMPRDQFLEGVGIAFLRGLHQRGIFS